MAQREGSTYLYLFIVACVLFMIMTVVFFIDNSDKQRIEEQLGLRDDRIKQLEASNRQLSDASNNLKILIAGPGGDTSWRGEEDYRNEMKTKAEAAINEVLADLKQSKRSYDSLIGCYGDIQGLFKQLIAARDEAFAKRETASQAEVKGRETSDSTVTELKKKTEEILGQLQELQTKFEDLDNKSKQEKAELVKEKEKIQDESSDRIIQLSRQINYKENQIKALDNRIDKLLEESRKEREFDEIEPDGKLVDVLGASGKGWINLGRVNHLRNGLVFRVFQYLKGGKKLYKGKVEVQRVDEDTSEVRIVEEVDGLNPIVARDMVSSPFYDPKDQPIFVFAGSELESRNVTKDYVISKMKSYGAQIRDKVDINTEFLVATKNFENTPEYKAARELGVTVIRERDLLEFIGQ